MSVSQPPSLEDYPGYFPAAKPPFWTKAKVGATAGICGLLLGIAGTASGDAGESEQEPGYSQRELDAAVGTARDEAHEEARDEAVAAFEGDADARVAALEEKLEAAEKAVAAERAKTAASQRVEVPQFVDVPSGGGGTDPRFDTCGDANDNGYGPYVSGADPEYDWYTDRDNDGRVCER